MQFLPSFHIVLTCSFVLLLAYVLSRFFTYLAHSAIHGSSSRARTKAAPSNETFAAAMYRLQEEDEHAAAMYRLQEEDEHEVGGPDPYQDHAERKAAPHKFEMGGGIFDDAIDQRYNLTQPEAAWDNGEGLEDATDKYGRYNNNDEEGRDKAQLLQDKDSKEGDMRRRVAARENGLSSAAGDDSKGGEEERDKGSESMLMRDAEGSSSLQRRLPPTWSDLEKIVSTGSMKYTVAAPSVSPVPEGW